MSIYELCIEMPRLHQFPLLKITNTDFHTLTIAYHPIRTLYLLLCDSCWSNPKLFQDIFITWKSLYDKLRCLTKICSSLFCFSIVNFYSNFTKFMLKSKSLLLICKHLIETKVFIRANFICLIHIALIFLRSNCKFTLN